MAGTAVAHAPLDDSAPVVVHAAEDHGVRFIRAEVRGADGIGQGRDRTAQEPAPRAGLEQGRRAGQDPFGGDDGEPVLAFGRTMESDPSPPAGGPARRQARG
jgi:hypothetical protein